MDEMLNDKFEKYHTYNKHLENMYASTNHLLKHIDNIEFIDLLKKRESSLAHRIRYWNCSYSVRELYPPNESDGRITSNGIPRYCNTLVGFLFRKDHFNIGDKIYLSFNNCPMFTIILDDLNKIYKPIGGIFYLLEHTFTYQTIKLCRDDRMPIAQDAVDCLFINDTLDASMIQYTCDFKYIYDLGDKIFFYSCGSGAIGNPEDFDITNCYNSKYFNFDYPYRYYANKIKRVYKRYTKRKVLLKYINFKDIVNIIESYNSL